ncbi:MAG: 2TM domain-containing protein [Flavobacteriaceae bacterium]
METKSYQKYAVAKKQVKKIKDFYGHLFLFAIVVPLVYVIRFFVLPKIGVISEEEGFVNWLNWHTYVLPLFWLFGIAIHAITVFKPKSISSWEKKKMQELIEKEEQKNHQQWK